MSLIKRIEKLEQEAEANGHGILIHWQFIEGTQHLHCAEHEFARQDGESLSAFTDRALAAVNNVSGEILWMNSSAA